MCVLCVCCDSTKCCLFFVCVAAASLRGPCGFGPQCVRQRVLWLVFYFLLFVFLGVVPFLVVRWL